MVRQRLVTRPTIVAVAALLVLGLYALITVTFASDFARTQGTSAHPFAFVHLIGAGYGLCGCALGVLFFAPGGVSRIAAGVAAVMTWLAALLPAMAVLRSANPTDVRIAVVLVVVAAAATAAWVALGEERTKTAR